MCMYVYIYIYIYIYIYMCVCVCVCVKDGHGRWIIISQFFIHITHKTRPCNNNTSVTHQIYTIKHRNNIHMRIYTQSNTILTLSLRKYISLMFSYLQPQLTLLTQHMCYTQNIYNKTQEQHSPAIIYTVQHRTNPCPYENTPD